MPKQVFLKVMDLSWSASMIIAIVFIVRILLKRFPKFISYILWSVVLFRRLCPVTLEFKISPVPNLKPVLYKYILTKDDIPIEGLLGGTVVPGIGGGTGNMPESGQLSSDGNVKAVAVS